MKKYLSIIFLLCNLSLYSQNRIINKEDIVGRYTVNENVISVVYYDMMDGNAKERKAHHIPYEIISFEDDRMVLLSKDYDYDYKISLKRLLN